METHKMVSYNFPVKMRVYIIKIIFRTSHLHFLKFMTFI